MIATESETETYWHSIDYCSQANKHRGETYSEWVEFKCERALDDMLCFLVKLDRDNCWWVVALLTTDDPNFTDRGPFHTMEEALINTVLISQPR